LIDANDYKSRVKRKNNKPNKMTQNPWQVDSVQAFVYINCPECSFKTKEEGFFQDHAVASHPMCFPLFGRTDIVIEEVTVEDQKPEYYIEVKAEEAPSELELASAIASLEETREDNIEIFDDASTHSIVESDAKIVVQSNDSNSPKTQIRAKSDKALENMLNDLDDDTPRKIAKAKIVKKEKASFAQLLDGLEDKTYKCYYCNKEFSRWKFLDLHYKKHLDKNGHFPCQHCSKMYPSYKQIKSHILNTHTPAFCKDCDKSFFSSTSYERHRKTVHVDKSIKKFKCDLCTFESHAKRYLEEHKQAVHGGAKRNDKSAHVCKKCNARFNNKGSLQHHLCNKSKKETEEQKFKCPTCDGVFNHKSFLIHHKRTHGGLPPGYENLKKHICDKCSEEFLSSTGLTQHKKNQMCVDGAKEIYCEICKPRLLFKSPTIFIKHYREIHNGYPPMYEHLPKYFCSQCPTICISEHQLKKHQRFSHSNKVIQPTKPKPRHHCTICVKDFSQIKALQNHMIMMHENSAQFQCEICNKRMSTARRLNEHIKIAHTKVTCEICHEVQYNWYYLKRHKASAHGMIPSGYSKCPQCALIFKNSCTLLKHINSKHR